LPEDEYIFSRKDKHMIYRRNSKSSSLFFCKKIPGRKIKEGKTNTANSQRDKKKGTIIIMLILTNNNPGENRPPENRKKKVGKLHNKKMQK
jgi:hypothetical protein